MLSLYQTTKNLNAGSPASITGTASNAVSSFAIIDMGSNSFRLCIFKNYQSNHCEKIKFVETCQLGESFHQTLTIQPVPMARGLAACEKFLGICREFAIEHIYAFATATVREAKNRGKFLSACENLGLNVHILSGGEEALCGFLGAVECCYSDDSACVGSNSECCSEPSETSRDNIAVFDIGGASFEIAIGSSVNFRGLFAGCDCLPTFDEIIEKSRGTRFDLSTNPLEFSHSFKVGAVRMTDMFGEDFVGLESYLEEMFSEFDSLSKTKLSLKNTRCIGIGGTITSLLGLILRCENYKPQLHGFTPDLSQIATLTKDLKTMTPKERQDLPFLKDKRKNIIAAGGCILETAISHYNVQKLSASLTDNLEGYRAYLGI